MNPPSVSLVVLRSTDPEETARFYELIGLRFTEEQHGAGPRHLVSTGGRTVVEIYPTNTGISAGAPNDLRIGFEIDDLDQTLALLVDVADTDPTLVDRDGRRVAIVVDPDGRSVELSGRA